MLRIRLPQLRKGLGRSAPSNPRSTIKIGDDITVTVVQARGGHAELAIDAPRDVRIRRGDDAAIGEPEPSRG